MHHKKIIRLTDYLFRGGLEASIDPNSGNYQEMMDEICDNLQSSGIVDVNTDLEYRVFNLISFCSVVSSCLVFLTGVWNKKLS